MIPELIEEDKFRPWKKNIWLSATPNNPHNIKRGISTFAIFVCLKSKLSVQKNNTAPLTLKNMKTGGLKKSGMTPFANRWPAPYKTLTKNKARCALRFDIFIIQILSATLI